MKLKLHTKFDKLKINRVKKIVIFTSDKFGLKIAKYLKNIKKYKIYFVVSKKNKQIKDEIERLNSDVFIFYEDLIKKYSISKFKKMNFDLLLSVYFNKILKEEIYKSAKKTINFHPSYLPHNKGCYPHVHGLLSGVGNGITLHELDKRIDSGKIWVQKKVLPKFMENQEDYHKRLKNELFNLFKKNLELILQNRIEAKKQIFRGNYNNKNSLLKFDKLILNKKYELKKLILLLKAREFKLNSYAYFDYNKKRYKILLKILK